MGYLEHRMVNLVCAPLFVPTPRNLRFRRAMRTFDDIVYGIIDERRQTPATAGGDLLSLLLTVRDPETGQAMTDREVRDQVLTFIGAGHETTAVALAWTFAMLGQHPEVHAAVRAEAAAVLGDRTPTAADVPALALTQRVIRETMRLYPPVYAVARDVAQTDEIAGFTIPRKSTVIVSPYLTQRHPEVWPEPDKFDPDRFTPEQSAGRARFAYFPFLGGPHQCIGEHFAMIEMTLVVAMIVRRFRVELAREGPITPKPLLATRPGGGVWIRVK
jgi:cytochrome P450